MDSHLPPPPTGLASRFRAARCIAGTAALLGLVAALAGCTATSTTPPSSAGSGPTTDAAANSGSSSERGGSASGVSTSAAVSTTDAAAQDVATDSGGDADAQGAEILGVGTAPPTEAGSTSEPSGANADLATADAATALAATAAAASVLESTMEAAGASGPVGCLPTKDEGPGPYYTPGAPERTAVGTGYTLSGIVLQASSCAAVPNAAVEIWLAGPDGTYSDDDRATLHTDAAGTFRFESSVPPAYENQAPHIHLRVTAPGFRPVTIRHFPDKGSASGEVAVVLEHT